MKNNMLTKLVCTPITLHLRSVYIDSQLGSKKMGTTQTKLLHRRTDGHMQLNCMSGPYLVLLIISLCQVSNYFRDSNTLKKSLGI